MNDTENEVDHEHEEILSPSPSSSKSNIWKFFSKEKKTNLSQNVILVGKDAILNY